MRSFTAKTKKELTIFDQYGDKIGHQMSAKIEKHKLTPPGKRAEFYVKFDEGIVRKEEEIFRLGDKYNIFEKEKPSSRTRIINGEKFTSSEDAIDYIRENCSIVEQTVRERVLNSDVFIVSEPENVEILNPFLDDDEG